MKYTYIYIITLYLICNTIFCQNNLIGIDARDKDIGLQEFIYKIKAEYIITNNLTKNLFLLRADAQEGIIIKASKKTIKPTDTCLIVIEFIPTKTGSFNKIINLVTSASGEPFAFSLSGNIKSIKTDDKTACYNLKKAPNNGVKNLDPIVVVTNNAPKDNSNKIPDNNRVEVNHQNDKPKTTEQKLPILQTPVKQPNFLGLDDNLYKPNNIVFLVDVSSSMKDTNKLNVMKIALYYLIDNLRPQDKVTFITYSDSVRLLQNGVTGNQKNNLIQTVKQLKAHGLTKGKKAILFGLDIAISHYLINGNNQLILATDGKFRFYPDDQKIYLQKQGNKNIILSTIAFGNDKDALLNLKEIAKIGKGNFIHIKSKAKAKEQLLDEIKKNSLIN